MRTNDFLRYLAWGTLGLVSQQAFSQASQANNNGGATSFLGWNTLANQILEVRNNANQPIQWFTDSIQRMQLWRTQSSAINGFSGIRQNGFLGISPQPQFYSSTVGPFSRLHLTDSISDDPVNYAQQYGYRPWMRNPSAGSGLAPSS